LLFPFYPKSIIIKKETYPQLFFSSYVHLTNQKHRELSLVKTFPFYKKQIKDKLTHLFTYPFTGVFMGKSTSFIVTNQVFIKPKLFSFTTIPLIFSNSGFLFLNKTLIVESYDFSYDSSTLKARVNNYRFSFFYKNDVKRIFLKKPGFLKLLTSFDSLNSSLTYDFFNQQSKHCGLNLLKNKLSRDLSVKISGRYFLDSLNKSRVKDSYLFSLNSGLRDHELSIKRVKFKPGYQRI